MSKFSNITTPELEIAKEALIKEVERLRRETMQGLENLENKSYELNDILIELEERNNVQAQPNNS